MRLLVTGGAGFSGANIVHHTLKERPEHSIAGLDALTYAGSEASLAPVWDRSEFPHGSVADAALVDELVQRHDLVVHFAAESHEAYFADEPQAAPRPRNSGLGLSKITATGSQPRHRRPALREYPDSAR